MAVVIIATHLLLAPELSWTDARMLAHLWLILDSVSNANIDVIDIIGSLITILSETINVKLLDKTVSRWLWTAIGETRAFGIVEN